MNSPTPAPKDALPAKYVFGPVPSRRLGRSLGIDLVPMKTCTYNCIYCQLGRTTNQTLKRKAYVPGSQVVEELGKRLSVLSSPPDYITFSGSGEPTLNSQIGWVIDQVNRMTPVPVAVLTNGSLLHLESVREALAAADLVIPSLDAATPALLGAMNRPHPSLHLSQVLRGLQEFRREFPGQIWLEIMVCGGFNDDPKEIKRLREEIEKISPDRIQLNTVVRPPTEDFAYPLSIERMEQVRELFGGSAEILPAECPAPPSRVDGQIDREVFSLLERRPCSLEDLSQAFGVSEETIERFLRRLRARGVLGYQVHNHTVFYKAKPNVQASLYDAR
jgi:wyosine [tRNA(Phe)-imidazoG37] synthetase (radical SAM superfamily)